MPNCSLVLIITPRGHVRKIATDHKQSLFNLEEEFEVKRYYLNGFETSDL